MIRDGNTVVHPLGARFVYKLDLSDVDSVTKDVDGCFKALNAKMQTLEEAREFIAGFDAIHTRLRDEIAAQMYYVIYNKTLDAARAVFHSYRHASTELVRAYLLKFCALAECDATKRRAASGSSYGSGSSPGAGGSRDIATEEFSSDDDDDDAFSTASTSVSEDRPPVAVDDRGVWLVHGRNDTQTRTRMRTRTFVFHAASITTQLTFARIATILAQLPAPKYARRAPRSSETPLMYLKYIAQHM
jgi:hypothetical protein